MIMGLAAGKLREASCYCSSSLKAVWKQNSSSLVFLLRSLTDCVKPTHIMEGKSQLYLKPTNLNVNHILRKPYLKSKKGEVYFNKVLYLTKYIKHINYYVIDIKYIGIFYIIFSRDTTIVFKYKPK